MAQIDNTPAALDHELWNWKSNFERGLAKIQELKEFVMQHSNRGQITNEEKFIKNVMYFYNHKTHVVEISPSGKKKVKIAPFPYRWNGKKWEDNFTDDYIAKAYSIYKRLQN